MFKFIFKTYFTCFNASKKWLYLIVGEIEGPNWIPSLLLGITDPFLFESADDGNDNNGEENEYSSIAFNAA